MTFWAVTVWVAGLLTVIPYGTYYLLFQAQRDQYAWLITLVLFWIFGYWGVVGPLLAAIKVHSVFRALERAQTRENLLGVLQNQEAREVAVDVIASENRIPRFLAVWVYRRLVNRLPTLRGSADPESDRTGPAQSGAGDGTGA